MFPNALWFYPWQSSQLPECFSVCCLCHPVLLLLKGSIKNKCKQFDLIGHQKLPKLSNWIGGWFPTSIVPHCRFLSSPYNVYGWYVILTLVIVCAGGCHFHSHLQKLWGRWVGFKQSLRHTASMSLTGESSFVLFPAGCDFCMGSPGLSACSFA